MAGDFALGEKAHNLPLLQRARHTADGVFRTRLRDRNRANDAQEPGQPGDVVKHIPHDEAQLAHRGRAEHDGIDITHMVRQQQHAALFRHVLGIHRLHVIHQAHDRQQDEAQEILAQQPRHVHRGNHGQRRNEDQLPGGGHMQKQHHLHHHNVRHDGSDAVHKIHGREHTREFIGRAAALHKGIQRRHEGPARQTDADHGEKNLRPGAGRQSGHERGQSQTDPRDRHDAQLHLAPRNER